MTQDLQPDTPKPQTSAWSIAFGGLIIALGILVFWLPQQSAIDIRTLLPWLFIAIAAAKFLYVFSTQPLGDWLIRSLGALLYLAVGVSLMFVAPANVVLFTFLVGMVLIGEGVTRLLIALQWRSYVSWWWIIADGFLGLTLGLLFWFGVLPELNWFLAVIFGTQLVFGGISRIRLAVECLPKVKA